MVVSTSLQLSHDLGFCKNFRRSKQLKGAEAKRLVHALDLSLSSHASRRDAWSLHLSNSIHGRKRVIPSRCNVLVCQSFLTPGQSNEIPVLKATALALKRSYNALHGSSLVLKLISAAGIIVFAVWGLGPLLRRGRKFVSHNDGGWKKSSTYYVYTSYLQPLLLWTGATLICRVLEPTILPTEASQAVKQRLLIFVRSLSSVLAFAYCLSSLIQQAQKFFMDTNDSSDTRNMGFQFAGRAVYTAVWVAAVSLFMELLGFSTQKWLTAGGLGTVLLTLAGREIFTNFLSSVMIHATRPFVLNEWIQTKIEGYEVSGTVEHVGWWSPTIIRGDDREAVHIPNHKFTVNVVRNLSQKTHWRIKTHLAISHLDVNKINNIVADMRKVLSKNPQVEQQRLHRRVFLDNVDPENQALLIMISCFVKTSHFEEYLCVKEAILLDLLRVISHHRARLATPIRTVQKFYGDADLENVPFSETIFTRANATAKRPLLLIEPPYRINGEDKSKSRSTRPTEDVNGKPAVTTDPKTAAPASDGAVQNSSDGKQKKKQNSGDTPTPKNNNSDAVTVPHIESLDSVGPNSSGAALEKPPIVSESKSAQILDGKESATTQHVKKESESSPIAQSPLPPSPPSPPTTTSRSALEENIVLGMALEGSKRTLPIEDDMAPSPAPTEPKELAARRNANSSSATTTKGKKDGQISSGTGPAAGDKRDPER
ncbi:hypothetical protein QJS10_CPB13g00209 [Acorus calamus]|uniref:Uncharacterized protein n=1 Tax=Acorus calamus TaxID=4465 RepID=A0AAV9DJ98_ACOCL|nr:hypothetical protein QJS10_CPB13g00209 [Acorus calamus]